MADLKYSRLLVKFSGESVAGDEGIGIDPKILDSMAVSIKLCKELGAEIGIVIGGGNLFRGERLSQSGMDRVAGDHMGMLATVMNGIALRDSLERANVKTRVMSALSISGLVEHFDRRRAIQLLKDGYVVIFTAGTGNPFFTTDTAGCLRAVETQSDIMLKATRVDGVYSADPEKDPNAKFYKNISFEEAISKNLRIMDGTAETNERMQKCMDSLSNQFNKIRTGRANPSILDSVKVDYYGNQTPINQTANISVEENRTLVISPWDKTLMPEIEKAIISSDLGLNPSSSGDLIRITMPALTEETRQDYIKQARTEAENARISIRSVRRDSNQTARDLNTKSELSDDELRDLEVEIQEITDKFISMIDDQLKHKEDDLIQI